MIFSKNVKQKPEQSVFNEIQELKYYLKNTDWYVIRLTDCGKSIPLDIIAKRNEARERINLLQGGE